MTVGVLLHRNDKGCVAVALVSGPGQAPARLVGWGGQVRLKAQQVPFRQPPESSVAVSDFAPCDGLVSDAQLGERDADVVAAIKAAAG
jgi:hypothetical protein